ncbi:MAG: zinc ribbon domain-containing protein [Cyclobacteriaceae bacterium]|nr:zinc ribbon domain-containing protein [Cyclobacteriaceae bacterium]
MPRTIVMPIYEFECPNGTHTEKFVKMGTKEIICPKCHKKARKIVSRCTFHLKGGGWYSDGYSSKKIERRK